MIPMPLLREVFAECSKTLDAETEISNELSHIAVELASFDNVNRSLFESLIDGRIDQSEFMELKTDYSFREGELKNRVVTLKQMLDDEKSKMKRLQESIHILDAFADTSVLTSEHIDRFVDRIILYNDSRVHVELALEIVNSIPIPIS
jgi:predicted YcjX-like family ATPase